MNLKRALLLACLWLGAAVGAHADPVVDFFCAVHIDNARDIKTLVRQVDPNTADPATGETGLILSLREGSLRVFDVLLAQPGIKLELTAPNGNTALMMAAFKHHKDAVLALLAKGAAVNRPGWTALHYAAASGDDEIVRILLAHRADIDARSPSGITPLMIAAREGHESTVRVLLEQGADATLVNNERMTAAQIAERADKPRIAAAIGTHQARAPGAKP